MKQNPFFYCSGFVSGVLVLGGCSTNPKPGFGDVEKTVAAHSGYNVRWKPESAAKAEAQGVIESLLQTNLTADTAVQIALINNPRLQGIFEEVGIAQADLVQAGLLRNPRIAASWRFPDRPPSGVNSDYSFAADFLDLIFLPLRKKVAARNLEATKLRVADEVLKLAAEVKTAFYAVQAHVQLAKRLQIIAEVNEAAADIAQRQHKAGNISDLELANQKAVYAQSRATLAEILKEIRTEREQVNRLLGLWGKTTTWTVADQLPALPESEIPFEKLESLAMSQRLDLASSRALLSNVASALSLRTKTRFVPTVLDVGVSSEKEPGGQRVTGPTLDLELPIFDRGQGRVAKLASQYRQAQREFEAMAIDARSQVREARDRLIANRDLTEYYQKTLLPLRIHIVNETLLHYNAMQVGPIDLLLAKERELDTERLYIEAWRDYWISRVDLERAVGGRINASPDTQAPLPSTSNPTSPQKSHQH